MCPFTKPGAAVTSPDSSGNNDPYVAMVKTFIEGGGKLVCWLTGHSHYDAISKTSAANGSQINICVGNASRYGSNNNLKTTDSGIVTDDSDFKTFDLFNLVCVDTTYTTISLLRVGSDRDKMGRLIETCCVNYATGEIVFP